jgi:hypothetical protein
MVFSITVLEGVVMEENMGEFPMKFMTLLTFPYIVFKNSQVLVLMLVILAAQEVRSGGSQLKAGPGK